MNWRGEQFYSKNTVREVVRQEAPFATLAEYVRGPGARKWIMVEQSRLAGLRQALGGMGRLKVIEARNNKFVLATIEKSEEPQGPPALLQPPPPAGPIGAPP